MSETMTVRYLSEVVLYGGIPVRRADVELHLDHLGVTGPARFVYGKLEPVDMQPAERWDPDTEGWIEL